MSKNFLAKLESFFASSPNKYTVEHNPDFFFPLLILDAFFDGKPNRVWRLFESIVCFSIWKEFIEKDSFEILQATKNYFI